MALRSDGIRTEKKVLSVCARLFLKNGYRQTTMQQILDTADVSAGSFHNLFRTKDGVLVKLVEFMFDNQFRIARSASGSKLPPLCVYAVETAIQLAITEMSESLRDLYLEAYTCPESLRFIQNSTVKELHAIFGAYQPELSERDFLALDFGSAGLMRGYMANPCTEDFPLEEKLRLFLTFALRGYRVPEDEVAQTLAFVSGLDIRTLSKNIMTEVFRSLALHYDFSLADLLPEE